MEVNVVFGSFSFFFLKKKMSDYFIAKKVLLEVLFIPISKTCPVRCPMFFLVYFYILRHKFLYYVCFISIFTDHGNHCFHQML